MTDSRREKKHEEASENLKKIKKIYSSIGHGKLDLTGGRAHTLYSLSSEAIVMQKIVALGDNEAGLVAFLKGRSSGNFVAKETVMQALIKAKQEANEALPVALQKLSLTKLQHALQVFHESKSAMSLLGRSRASRAGF